MVSPDYIDRQGVAHWKENSIHTSSQNLLQFTGLKDKNGKEIFEGDIVKASTTIDGDQKLMAVEWSVDRCNFSTYHPKINGGWFPNIRKDTYLFFEVIGNIFENPELLT